MCVCVSAWLGPKGPKVSEERYSYNYNNYTARDWRVTDHGSLGACAHSEGWLYGKTGSRIQFVQFFRGETDEKPMILVIDDKPCQSMEFWGYNFWDTSIWLGDAISAFENDLRQRIAWFGHFDTNISWDIVSRFATWRDHPDKIRCFGTAVRLQNTPQFIVFHRILLVFYVVCPGISTGKRSHVSQWTLVQRTYREPSRRAAETLQLPQCGWSFMLMYSHI